MDFQIKNGEEVRTVIATIASATVVEAGDLVALDSGIIVKAVAASTELAYAPWGSADGETEIEITMGNDFTLLGTTNANFAVTDKGIDCDLVGTTTLLIDIGTTSTNVFKVGASDTSGTVDSKLNVEVRLNTPITF